MVRHLSLLLLFLVLLSCSRRALDLPVPPEENPPGSEEISAYKSGRMIIKVSSALSQDLESHTRENGLVTLSQVESMADAAGELSVTSLKRLFPPAGRFEARTRLEGLHRWYELVFDETIPLDKATNILNAIPGIDALEYDPINRLYGEVETAAVSAAPLEDAPFDDPLLYRQWHYWNDGSEQGAESGCDIQVFPVWEDYAPVRNDVIVCVVDGGVDFTHEDLADNMWHNPEQEGDARFGYNFQGGSYVVTPDKHGTHVAGTIAAVNNNATGVCGIAGGDRARGIPGVKVMSCQIFTGNESVNGAPAIKWGADHGAVICQNSWGYPDLDETPESIRAAVDYFVKYAGLDENGVQTGPMAGGLVVFAAGNEYKNGSSSSYDGILNVVSVGADFCKAAYSNWGSFADLAAPGGDSVKGNRVLSTYPDNKYGWMSGTSMACPHVSGVAALVVSLCGGPGFTSTELRTRLEASAVDISAWNPDCYVGKGLVNALGAVSFEAP